MVSKILTFKEIHIIGEKKPMKKNNPLKKLRFIKSTIAHLNNEQMFAAHGGDTNTKIFCTDTTTKTTNECSIELCTGDSVTQTTDDCADSNICA